jgi:hypothetical protein
MIEAGYRLIKIADGSIAQTWGGVPGQSPGVPSMIMIPRTVEDGIAVFDHVHCPELGGEYNGFRLEKWFVDPPAKTVFDGAEFLGRVTDAEYGAILAAASTSVQIARWLDIFRLRGEIDVTGTTSIAAKNGLVALGLLTAERADIIFAAA